MEDESESKVDLVINVAQKCADVLKDPTLGGTKELSAEARSEEREKAYEDLTLCLNALGGLALFHEDFFDIISIANKLEVDAGNYVLSKKK